MKAEHVWGALDALARDKGWTPSGLARRAGLDATAFNKSKRVAPDGRPRWPTMETIARALEAAGEDFGMFALLLAVEDGSIVERGRGLAGVVTGLQDTQRVMAQQLAVLAEMAQRRRRPRKGAVA